MSVRAESICETTAIADKHYGCNPTGHGLQQTINDERLKFVGRRSVPKKSRDDDSFKEKQCFSNICFR